MTKWHIQYQETDPKTGCTLKIVLDDSGTAESPLSWDDAIIFAVLHQRYINPAQKQGLNSVEEIESFGIEHAEEYKAFPLFLYDHGNVSYSINSFACPWDSGRIGSIFLKRSEFPNPEKAAQSICEEYTSWANGEIYGYVVEGPDGEERDSWWGFIGNPEGYILEEGRASLKSFS